MKNIILLVGFLLLGNALKAQFNYAQWGWGVGVNSVKAYSDVKQNDNRFSFNADLYYNYSPYLPIALEIQAGQLSGGDNLTDQYHRYFTNNFISLSLHGDWMLGDMVDYYDSDILHVLKDFYLGTGIGLTRNNITNYREISLTDPTFNYHVTPHSINLLLPLRFGYEFKFYNDVDEPVWAIDIAYVHNLTFGEGLDGYNDPPSRFKNNSQDMFRQISIGVRFNFGNPVSYVKPIF